MKGRIRVVVVSHGSLVAENRKLWECLGRDGDFELTVLAPPRHRAALRDHELEQTPHCSYRLTPARTWLSRNRFSNHLHFYREKVRRVLRDGPPDVVFVQEEPWTVSVQQVVLLRDRRSRILFHTAQNQVKRYPFPFNVFRRNALRVSDAAAAVCEEAAEVLRRQGYRKPIHLLPLGVDTELLVPSPARRERWRGRLGLSGFVVGYMGRLTAAKGIFDLLGALARLDSGFRLMLVGEGPDREALLRCARQLGLEQRVTMVGVVSHSQVPSVLPAMDVLVLASHTTRAWKEQFGRVLIEAMACGVPVVGSSSAEIPRTIGEAGLVFPEKDAAALAEVLARLRSSPQLRRELVRKGTRRARQFAWDALARKLAGILREVLESPRAAEAAERRPEPMETVA